MQRNNAICLNLLAKKYLRESTTRDKSIPPLYLREFRVLFAFKI